MTNRYQKVLLAVDFHEDNASVVETAKELSELYSADLHVVHVREPLGLSCAVDGLSWVDEAYALEERVHKENKKKMTELGNKLGLKVGPGKKCFLIIKKQRLSKPIKMIYMEMMAPSMSRTLETKGLSMTFTWMRWNP